ncbi:MAG: hypothetical protein ACE5I1_21505 [bacterium]
MQEIKNNLFIDKKFDFESVHYVPVRFHKRTQFCKAVYKNIDLSWPNRDEISVIADWFKREDIYRAFGFTRPPLERHIQKSRLPDNTGRFDCVEFLLIKDIRNNRNIGFIVAYARIKGKAPHQEIDFTLADGDLRGNTSLLLDIKICMLTYFFAVRGVQTVFWVRRKKISDGASEGGEPRMSAYRQKDKRFEITRQQFKRFLQRLENTNLIDNRFPRVSFY